MKIVLGGLAGTGTSTIGRLLAKQLDYPFMSGGNMFRAAAEERGLTMEAFDQLMLEKPEERIDKEIDDRQKKYGEQHKDFIFESRLGWYFIPDAFKVKLDCDLDTRIERIVSSGGEDRSAYTQDNFIDTKEKTLERESDHRQRINELYNIEDLADNDHYDLVVDTTTMTPGDICDLILEHAEKYFSE